MWCPVVGALSLVPGLHSQTSSIAACGHELAQQTEPPPPATTTEQVAAALAAAEAALVQEQRP